MWVQDILEGKGFEGQIIDFYNDVRDTARAHIRAAEIPAAKVRPCFSLDPAEYS